MPMAVKKGRPSGCRSLSFSGVTLYQRMGSILPPLPPEKPYTGPIDEAFGAYQRGLYELALKKALPRAEAGDAAAQTLVAEMMVRGQGLPQDTQGAVFWYGEAAKRGDPAAMFQYALVLMDGRYVARDKAKADDYMRRAAEAGNSSAQFINWAQILVSDQPGESGLKMARCPFYEKAAAQGVADAQYAVAQLYVAIKDLPAEKKRKHATGCCAPPRLATIRPSSTWACGTSTVWAGTRITPGLYLASDCVIARKCGGAEQAGASLHLRAWHAAQSRRGRQMVCSFPQGRAFSDPELEDFYLGINDEISRNRPSTPPTSFVEAEADRAATSPKPCP